MSLTRWSACWLTKYQSLLYISFYNPLDTHFFLYNPQPPKFEQQRIEKTTHCVAGSCRRLPSVPLLEQNFLPLWTKLQRQCRRRTRWDQPCKPMKWKISKIETKDVLWTELPIPSPSMFAKDTCVAKNCWQNYLLVIYLTMSLRIIFIRQSFS